MMGNLFGERIEKISIETRNLDNKRNTLKTNTFLLDIPRNNILQAKHNC